MLQIKVNEYQTPITEQLLEIYPEEVRNQFEDMVTNIPLISWLISDKRPRAKDLPRDEYGRIIVDITHPHILEDMDYFRQPALHFLEHGCYTFLRPDGNPKSPYKKFWLEEMRRCRDGYVRESDGEWIPGQLYFFLNYVQILVTVIEEGKKKARKMTTFPHIWEGLYLRFHYLYQARENGSHAIELAKRGCGKSLSLSSIMAHNLLLGEDTLSKQGITTILTAHAKEYLGDKDGTLLKFTNAINFVWKNTPFPHKLLKSSMSDYTWIMGYKDPITDAEMGSRNQVLGVSTQQDADKIRGKRGWILFEEMGSYPSLISLYDTTRRSVEDGSYTFALMYLVGTSSQKDSNFASAKTLLYKTKSYNIYTLENVYDKSSQGKDTFGYFFPSYMNRTGCYNKDGVSDVVKGLLEILSARYSAREADPASILSVIAEDPITPAEAMIKVQDNFFPVAQLSERANQLDSDPKAYDDIYVGNLVFSKGKQLEFKPTEDIPLRKWRLDLQDSKQGALEIYAMPEKSPNGEIIYDRYIVGHDPVDNDSSETTSLSSTFVFDMFTDTIVAEFTGRLPFADDNYEIVRKLCLFYNAKCLYESNIKGLFAYFQRYNCLYLLAETPTHLRDQQYVKYASFGNNKYGVRANASINNYANRLLRDWLLKPMNVISEEGEITVPTLMTIRNRALIDELVNFNPIVNVDRIRAMGMVMLLRQELIVQYQGEIRHEEEIGEDLANDEFFKKNYDDRFGIGAESVND